MKIVLRHYNLYLIMTVTMTLGVEMWDITTNISYVCSAFGFLEIKEKPKPLGEFFPYL